MTNPHAAAGVCVTSGLGGGRSGVGIGFERSGSTAVCRRRISAQAWPCVPTHRSLLALLSFLLLLALASSSCGRSSLLLRADGRRAVAADPAAAASLRVVRADRGPRAAMDMPTWKQWSSERKRGDASAESIAAAPVATRAAFASLPPRAIRTMAQADQVPSRRALGAAHRSRSSAQAQAQAQAQSRSSPHHATILTTVSQTSNRSSGMVSVPLAPPPPSIRVSTTFSSDPFMRRVSIQYALIRPELKLEVEDKVDTVGALMALVRGEVDAALTSHVPTAAETARAPDIRHLPLWAYAYAPATNVPAMSGVQFVLDVAAVCRIYRGNITRWDDPALVALNPQLRTAGAAAAVPIELALMTLDMTFLADFTRLCPRVDPDFAALIRPASKPVWPRHLYARYALVDDLTDAVSYVMATPNSLALVLVNLAQHLGAQVAAMQNSAGFTVQPAYASIDAAIRERAVVATRSAAGRLSYAFSGDLSNGAGQSVWPLTSVTMLAIPRSYTRTTCRARSELVKLLRWMMDSHSIRYTLGASETTVLLPEEVDTQLALRTTLQRLQCTESRTRINVGSSYTITAGVSSVASTHTRTREILSLHYASHDTSLSSVSNVVLDTRTALDRLMDPAATMDVVFIYPQVHRQLFPLDIEKRAAAGQMRFMPQAVHGIIPTYSFDTEVIDALKAARALPLKVDMETLGGIFTGAIRSWTHPALTSFNPALGAVFSGAAASSPESQITLVLCGVGDRNRLSHGALSSAFVFSLNKTAAVRDSGLPWSLPADWRPLTARLDALGVRYVLVSDEIAMEAAIDRIAGAVGYKLAFSNTTNPETDFAIVKYVQPTALDVQVGAGAGAAEFDATAALQPYNVTVFGVPAAFRACAEGVPSLFQGLDFDLQTVAFSTIPAAEQCWPFPLLVSIALPADVSVLAQGALTGQVLSENSEQALAEDHARLCEHQGRVARYAEFLLFDAGLDEAQTRGGFSSLNSVPWAAARARQELNGVWCAGQPLLYTPNIVWQLSDTVSSFAGIASLFLLALAGIALVLLVKFRSRTMIRSANMPLQLAILAGIVMLLVCPILYVQTADAGACRAIAWLVCLGSTLMYGPIAAKIWRVHATFQQRRSLKAKRIGIRHLYALVAVLLLIDTGLLLAFNTRGEGMLTPQLTLKMENSRVHEYHQCAPADDALPALVALFAVKALLLLVAAVLAFGVRHVSSAFGESESLSWSLWNSLLSSAILIIILVLVGEGAGDVHTFLLVFMVLWIAGSTLAFAFGKKFVALLSEEWRSATEMSRLSRTHMSMSGTGFSGSGVTGSTLRTGSFATSARSGGILMPSLGGVALAVLEKYMTALETQLRLAKQRRQKDFGSPYQEAPAGDESIIIGGDGSSPRTWTGESPRAGHSGAYFKATDFPINHGHRRAVSLGAGVVAGAGAGEAHVPGPVGHSPASASSRVSTASSVPRPASPLSDNKLKAPPAFSLNASVTVAEQDRSTLRVQSLPHSAGRSPGLPSHTHTHSPSSRATPSMNAHRLGHSTAQYSPLVLPNAPLAGGGAAANASRAPIRIHLSGANSVRAPSPPPSQFGQQAHSLTLTSPPSRTTRHRSASPQPRPSSSQPRAVSPRTGPSSPQDRAPSPQPRSGSPQPLMLPPRSGSAQDRRAPI